MSQQLGGPIGLAVFGTIAANVTKNELVDVRPTHAVISHALTTGFATAFEVGVPVALAGFVLALLPIRVRSQQAAPTALPKAE